jgi:hypothetical protein
MREDKMHEPGKLSRELTDEDLTQLLQSLRCPDELTPRAGFYARVMDRVESQDNKSVWSVFLEPIFGRRLAMASAALMLLLGLAFFTTPQAEEEFAFNPDSVVMDESRPAPALGGRPVDALRAEPVSLMNADQGRNVVLADLIQYQEH